MKGFITIATLCLMSASVYAEQPADPLALDQKSVAAAQAILKNKDCHKLDELHNRVGALISDQENLPSQYGANNPKFKKLSADINKVSAAEGKMIEECGKKGYHLKPNQGDGE
jgi:hypothetical protein